MMELIIIFIGFFLANSGCKIVQRGRKIQTAWIAVLFMHIVVAIMVYFLLSFIKGVSLVTITIFWVGAFVFWFNVCTLIESSILLHMLYLLKVNAPITKDKLLGLYQSHYGAQLRIEELLKGGLIELCQEEIVVSSKGSFIVKMFSIITYMWREDKVHNATHKPKKSGNI